jgi:hypothetical protein
VSAKRNTSQPEREAIAVQRALALRMEEAFPVAAAAILNATPRLEEGTLVLGYESSLRRSRKAAYQFSKAMTYFTDHPIRVERVRAP